MVLGLQQQHQQQKIVLGAIVLLFFFFHFRCFSCSLEVGIIPSGHLVVVVGRLRGSGLSHVTQRIEIHLSGHVIDRSVILLTHLTHGRHTHRHTAHTQTHGRRGGSRRGRATVV